MTSFNNTYSKYVFLPSGGGADYSPDCFLKMVNNNLSLLHINSNLYNTEFEYIFQILKNHTDKPMEQLCLFDFYYLWFIIKSNFIKKRTNDVFSSSCSFCETKQKIGLSFEKLIIRQNNNVKIENIIIEDEEFRVRKVIDNLRLPYLTMTCKNITEKIIIYVWQQSKKPLSYFESMHLKKVLSIYIELTEYNKVFGIYDNLYFECGECKKKNTFSIFNDFALCNFSFDGSIGETDKIEFYKNILKILQTKIINTSDYFTIPYKDSSAFFGAFNQLDFSLSQRFL